MIVELTRVHKHGTSLCVLLTKQIRDSLTWRSGDKVAVRFAGEKLVLERVAIEKLALIRTGEPAPTP
jgi:antitoxin component of MazEF toxin-antitoxin module